MCWSCAKQITWIPILWMRKLRFKDLNQLAQSCRVGGRIRTWTPVSLTPESMLFTTTFHYIWYTTKWMLPFFPSKESRKELVKWLRQGRRGISGGIVVNLPGRPYMSSQEEPIHMYPPKPDDLPIKGREHFGERSFCCWIALGQEGPSPWRLKGVWLANSFQGQEHSWVL